MIHELKNIVQEAIHNQALGTKNVLATIGLNKYNPKKDTFKTYFSEKTSTSLRNHTISAIKELSNKELWVGTFSGLSVYDESTDAFKNFLSGSQILSIFETRNGSIFIGTSAGLKQC